MTNTLQQRARDFLARPVPKELDYVPDSVAELLIADYAASGTPPQDPEMLEVLHIIVVEENEPTDYKNVDVRDYMQESHDILKAILKRTEEPLQ